MLFYWLTFCLSLLVLLIFSLLAIQAGRAYKSTRLLSSSRLLAVGVFFAIWLLFLPHTYLVVLDGMPVLPRIWQSLWIGVYQVIRFFVVAADYSDLEAVSAASGIGAHTVLGTFLLILAPLLTFSVILSFFRNFSAYRKYLMHPHAPTYVFSELNEKSFHLAADIKHNHRDAVILFSDVFEENNEENFELVERAKEIGAICFKKDMLSLNLSFHSKNSLLCFFAMAEENSVRGAYRQLGSSITAEEENLRQAYRLANDPFYAKRPHTKLFVFSSTVQGEILLDNLPKSILSVRRVERFRPLIMRTLFEDGQRFLFENAVTLPDGTKAIRALILGAGGYGSEMVKALCWCCQMNGYSLSIDVLDYDETAAEKFAFACPGLLENNASRNPGMPQYTLTVHEGISTDSAKFVHLLRELPRPTYVLAALGADERNIDAALTVRRIYRQSTSYEDNEPFIHAIVYESENRYGLENATNDRGEHYNIHYIGDLASSYSERVILNEEMTSSALKWHQKYVPTDFEYDFHLRSAMSITLWEHFARVCGVKTAEKSDNTSALTDEQIIEMELAEHKRWCAFMFSEGYVYAPQTHGRRDAIAKTHADLVPFDQLDRPVFAPKERIEKA